MVARSRFTSAAGKALASAALEVCIADQEDIVRDVKTLFASFCFWQLRSEDPAQKKPFFVWVLMPQLDQEPR